jgi:uncharacterized protein (TIRG00374 family)
MRKFVLVLVGLLTLAFIVFGLAELQSIRSALAGSNLVFLTGALLFEMLCLLNGSALFGALYRLVGLSETRSRLFLMATAAGFVNLIAPSGGASGMAVFLDSARERNQPAARVVVVGILYVIYEYASLFCIMVPGFAVLILRRELNTAEVIAAGMLVLMALAVGAVPFLAYHSSERLGRVLAWLSRLMNRMLRSILHRELLSEQKAHTFSVDVAEGIAGIRGSGRSLVWPLLFTLNNKALLLCVLAFSFLALNTPFTIDLLLGAFSISYLFLYVSLTPSGIGIVEGVLPAALNAFGIPWTQAVLITLAFRGITVWFPLALGALAFRQLQRQAALRPQASS